jgi:exonuclease VII large subunit
MQRVAKDVSTGTNAGGTDRKASSRVFAPAEVQRAIKRVVEEKLGAFSIAGLVVEGTLGEMGEGSGRYSYIYGVPLHDPVEGTVLELSIPRRLADRARGLERSEVRARGDLEPNVYQGKVSFRLTVREMQAAEPNEGGEGREAERRLSALLRGWSRGGRRFPQPPRPGSKIRATVIHSVTGVVLDDFTRQLGDAGGLTEVRALAVATNSSEEIAQAIRAAEGELVVLIRGGGSPQDFEPFNDERVVQAWMAKDAFIVSALGHSGDVTLLDPLSDLSCPTPTAAGVEVRERLLEGIDRSAMLGTAPDYSRQNRDIRRLKLALALACALVGLLLLLLLYGATAASL